MVATRYKVFVLYFLKELQEDAIDILESTFDNVENANSWSEISLNEQKNTDDIRGVCILNN